MNASVDRYLIPSGQSKSSHMIFIGYSAHSVQAQVEILIRRIPRSINDFTQFTGSFKIFFHQYIQPTQKARLQSTQKGKLSNYD